jgi:SAM-dependent methyltransferase
MSLFRLLIRRLRHWYFRVSRSFDDSESYWKKRYELGGTSGAGSYHALARFKAQVLNDFVREQDIRSVIEFGCGDGNQLLLAKYPEYFGLDVSPLAVNACRSLLASDESMRFALAGDYDGETADLSLSLDVIYHLVEDDVYHAYMARLFDAGERFVIVYSSNTEDNSSVKHPHVRHRRFTEWVAEHRPGWRLDRHIPNAFPYQGDDRTGSFADFYVFVRS